MNKFASRNPLTENVLLRTRLILKGPKPFVEFCIQFFVLKSIMIQFKTLRTIDFSELDLWDVKRFSNRIKTLTNDIFLRDLLSLSKVQISKEELIKNDWRIISKINYQGELFLLDKKQISTYKGRLYKVPPNSIIYSKMGVPYGGVYYHGTHQHPFAVSSEYPIFTFSPHMNGEYLQLVFRSSPFQKFIHTKISGSSRARVQVEEFLKSRIPLFTLEEQKRWVQNYKTQLVLTKQQEQQAKQLEQEIESYLLNVLGIRKFTERTENQKGLQFVNYKHLVYWNGAHHLVQYSDKFCFTSICRVAQSVLRGKSPKYDNDGKSKILNQKCNRWNSLELEHSKKVNDKWALSVDKKFLTREGDILINSLGEGTIGRSTFITQQNEGLLYDSCMILLRLDQKRVNPKFFSYLLNSQYGQNQVEDLKSARSTNQTSLCVKNLKKMMFPLPPKVIQNKIANHISRLRMQIQEFKKQAKHNREKVIIELEKEIWNIA